MIVSRSTSSESVAGRSCTVTGYNEFTFRGKMFPNLSVSRVVVSRSPKEAHIEVSALYGVEAFIVT